MAQDKLTGKPTAVLLVLAIIGGAGTLAAASTATLSGTWYGSFTQPGGTPYTNDGLCELHVKDEGTFTVQVTTASAPQHR